MPDISQKEMGGTMRLGARTTVIDIELPSSSSPSIAGLVYGLKNNTSSLLDSKKTAKSMVTSTSLDSLPAAATDNADNMIKAPSLPTSSVPNFPVQYNMIGQEYRPGFSNTNHIIERHRHRYTYAIRHQLFHYDTLNILFLSSCN